MSKHVENLHPKSSVPEMVEVETAGDTVSLMAGLWSTVMGEWTDGRNILLTPEQARRIAEALTKAADEAEANVRPA